ncbi:hypothetical protein CRG98_020287 [Punica granatum]|uniref:Uncharacterized protein n=1 Tax=Punica granatum TaxID=22663 RepID=A0A2I0JST9_PUNGR|nr:hypothetical protein CRG98_020287 [Punica granatum]
MKRWLCTVDRPSDRDHLFTGEGEGCEEPFERDGTTRQSRGTKWHAWKARCTLLVALGTRCSGIVVVSVFRGHAPKARREAFMATETSLGRPSRIPEGHLKLVPRPWWSLGTCRPVSGCRLLISGSGLSEPRCEVVGEGPKPAESSKVRSPWKAVKCGTEARGKQKSAGSKLVESSKVRGRSPWKAVKCEVCKGKQRRGSALGGMSKVPAEANCPVPSRACYLLFPRAKVKRILYNALHSA